MHMDSLSLTGSVYLTGSQTAPRPFTMLELRVNILNCHKSTIQQIPTNNRNSLKLSFSGLLFARQHKSESTSHYLLYLNC